MKRPNKNEYLKYGINAGITLDLYDKYIDYLQSQLKEIESLLAPVKPEERKDFIMNAVMGVVLTTEKELC